AGSDSGVRKSRSARQHLFMVRVPAHAMVSAVTFEAYGSPGTEAFGLQAMQFNKITVVHARGGLLHPKRRGNQIPSYLDSQSLYNDGRRRASVLAENEAQDGYATN